MESVCISGPMAKYITEDGLTENKKEVPCLLTLKVNLDMESGRMVQELNGLPKKIIPLLQLKLQIK